MYTKIVYNLIVCDTCGTACRGLFSAEKAADQHARNCGWMVDGTEHLCPRCQKTRVIRLREE